MQVWARYLINQTVMFHSINVAERAINSFRAAIWIPLICKVWKVTRIQSEIRIGLSGLSIQQPHRSRIHADATS